MSKKTKDIPINAKSENGEGIFISKTSVEDSDFFDDKKESHRDDYHLFLLRIANNRHLHPNHNFLSKSNFLRCQF